VKAILLFLGLLLWALPSWATSPTFSNTNIFVASYDSGVAAFASGPGTYKSVYTSETVNGQASKVISLIASNTDTTTDHIVTCETVVGGTASNFIQATVSHQTGTVAPTNMLSSTVSPGLPIDNNGNPYRVLHNGDTLQCEYSTALSNGWVDIDTMVQNF